MNHTILKPFFIAGSLLLLFVSFSCVPDSIVTIKESHNPELNNKCIISGYILDKDTKDQLIDAIIMLNNGEYETHTNVDGFFTINDLPVGDYKITVKYIGYKNVTRSHFHVKSNYIYELKIELILSGKQPEGSGIQF